MSLCRFSYELQSPSAISKPFAKAVCPQEKSSKRSDFNTCILRENINQPAKGLAYGWRFIFVPLPKLHNH